ncbi:hypothetical protein PYW07_013241 [Mythimna separata]|uniref:MADF domain-containing protein n=1 Tax=Mythimna separata TaxID=271217 RepID=A0AAD7Y6B3_MYTSE|nr:hypothetical protein PYW07_013241 [Mythimna separata]
MKIDTERVIIEVHLRPCLWDKSHELYKNRDARSAAWEEILKELTPNFESLSEKEKKNADKKIQQRWRTARDTYSKEKSSDKKQPSGSASQKKKKYSFYDMLTFLDKTTDIDVDETLSEEHTQDSSLQSGNTDSQTSANKHQPSSTIELVQEQSSTETQPSTSGLQGINERTGNAKKKPKRANSEFEAELLKLLKSSELEIAPDDLAFYKSIQPALNRFKSYQKLMFRTKVLNLLMEMEHQIQSLNNFYQQESIGTNNESNYDSMSPFGDLNQTLHNTSEGDENILVSALVDQDIVDTTTSGTDSLQHNSNID